MKSIEDFLDAHHSLRDEDVASLPTRDLDSFAEFALRGSDRRRRGVALRVLGQSGRTDIAVPVLTRIVVDSTRSLEERIASARWLEHFPGPASAAALLEALGSGEDQLLMTKLVAALGHVADASAIPALEGLTEGDSRLARQARFARLLIEHRLQVKSDQEHIPHGKTMRVAAAAAKPLSSVDIDEKDLKRLQGLQHGKIPIGSCRRIACEGGYMFVVLGLVEPALPRAKAVIATVFKEAKEDAAISVYRYVLSTPESETSARITVFRRDGTATMVGQIREDRRRLLFDVHTLADAAEPPVDLSGRVDEGQFDLIGWIGTEIPKRNRRMPGRIPSIWPDRPSRG